MVRPDGLKEARGRSDRGKSGETYLKRPAVYTAPARINTRPRFLPAPWASGTAGSTPQQTRRCSPACPVPRLQVIEAQSPGRRSPSVSEERRGKKQPLQGLGDSETFSAVAGFTPHSQEMQEGLFFSVWGCLSPLHAAHKPPTPSLPSDLESALVTFLLWGQAQ